MRYFLLLLIFLLAGFRVFSQSTGLPPGMEQALENITARNDDSETEDDAYLQEMAQFVKHPVNLNTADENLLAALMILTPLQIRSLIAYRSLLGKLVSIYELQSLPAWDIHTVSKIRPFVTVSTGTNIPLTLKNRLSRGDNYVLLRLAQTLERAKGFLKETDSSARPYGGSPLKLLVRYKYVYKDLLQFGITGEKDAGEAFFKGNQRQGFDFYSAHFFIRNAGMIKALALGDFTVNFGQGLTQWQSLAFKKGADVLAIKRQSAVLKPYNSSGEINFHRGIALTIRKNKWEVTTFGSYRKTDGNLVSDTVQSHADFISSLQLSGYHRTKAETEDKNVQRQLCFGANISYQYRQLHVGVNAIRYHFRLPLVKAAEPYNKYALPLKDFGNYSLDYGFSFRNMHFFGELAGSSKKQYALVQGLLIGINKNVDMSLLYRNISRAYQSLYTNAFTENTYPINEKGLFIGIDLRPSGAWQITAYADMYGFPWLRYRVNSPSTGSDQQVQFTYRPNKQLEVYSRYKKESRAINYNPDGFILSPVVSQPFKNWQIQLNYRINQQFVFRNRVEMAWFDKKGMAESNGFSIYAELFFKPSLKPYAANMRLHYFETDDYNSRLYAYENDVLYYFSIPVLYGKGYRYYLNMKYDISKKLQIWFRWDQTIYPGKSALGSGSDEIKGNKKSAIKLQLQYKF